MQSKPVMLHLEINTVNTILQVVNEITPTTTYLQNGNVSAASVIRRYETKIFYVCL